MDNKEYFGEKENEGYARLERLNQEKHFFETIGRTPVGYDYDASGVTKDGVPVSIEIKIRDLDLTDDNKVSGKTFVDETLLVEARKVAGLLIDHVITGAIPLYVNFLNNATVIFNFLKFSKKPEKRFFKAQNYGRNGMELGDRYLLPITEGYIYRRGNNEQ